MLLWFTCYRFYANLKKWIGRRTIPFWACGLHNWTEFESLSSRHYQQSVLLSLAKVLDLSFR